MARCTRLQMLHPNNRFISADALKGKTAENAAEFTVRLATVMSNVLNVQFRFNSTDRTIFSRSGGAGFRSGTGHGIDIDPFFFVLTNFVRSRGKGNNWSNLRLLRRTTFFSYSVCQSVSVAGCKMQSLPRFACLRSSILKLIRRQFFPLQF